MKKLILLLLLTGGFYSCSTQTDKHTVYTSFKETDTLVTDIHSIPPIMLYPRAMYLTDSFLVVYNRNMDTCYQAFDKKTLAYRYSFGMHGQGPTDFEMPQERAVLNTPEKIVINDGNKLKTITFQQGGPSITTQDMPVEQPYFNGLFQLNDTMYVCDADYQDNEEFMFIHTDGTTEKKVTYPETTKRFKDQIEERNGAYQFIAAPHPSGEKFVSFYVHARRFQIIDKEGNILKDVRLEIPPYDKEIPLEQEQRRIYVMDVFATANHIYTLNLDMTSEEIAAQKELASIQVFSWDGEPLKQLYLDRFISAFTVDEQAQLIYGGFVEVEDAIYTFNLSGK